MGKDVQGNEEIEQEKLQILNEIYANENKQLKHEYRVLRDKCSALENESTAEKEKLQQLQADYSTLQLELKQTIEKYENSLGIKATKKIKNSIFYRGLMKMKNIAKKG